MEEKGIKAGESISFDKRRPRKRIRLEHAQNVRDLGGIECEDKRVTRWGKLIRSDGISNLNDVEWETLTDYGVRTVLDLRSPAEMKNSPDRVPANVRYIPCSLQKQDLDSGSMGKAALEEFARSMEESYCQTVKESPELLGKAVRAVMEGAARGGVLFHCSAGKDRTGVLAAVLLVLLGADEEDIIADYQVSYTYNRKGINRQLEHLPQKEILLPLLKSEGSTMEYFLGQFGRKELERLLFAQGITLEDIAHFQEQVLE